MPPQFKTPDDLFSEAIALATMGNVLTPPNGLVLYSTSFLPTKINRDSALACVEQDRLSRIILDHVPAGLVMDEMRLFDVLEPDQAYMPWYILSHRLVAAATGNVTAFVGGADPRSTFARIEVQGILDNPNIVSVNNVAKQDWFTNAFPVLCPAIVAQEIENPRARILTIYKGASINRALCPL